LQPTDTAGLATMMQWISVANDYLYDDLVSALSKGTPGETTLAAQRLHDVFWRRLVVQEEAETGSTEPESDCGKPAAD
jgi:hypothetical protein